MICSNGHGNIKGGLDNWAIVHKLEFSKWGYVISVTFSSSLVYAIPKFVLVNIHFKYGMLQKLTCLLAKSFKCQYFIA